MSTPQVERSNQRGKFGPSELAAKVKESRAYWASAKGKQHQAQLDREKRNRKPSPTKFPGLATSTKPGLVTGTDLARRKLDLIDRKI